SSCTMDNPETGEGRRSFGLASSPLPTRPPFLYWLCRFLLFQVLRRKHLDGAEVQQVSVRRFSSFNLFSRTEVPSSETDEPLDGQWVEYRSGCFPQYSAFLRDDLGPLRVDEVLNSFDNTGNVCEYTH
uniref:Uncharacterized protein n=1 Tax=Electrophorus electricus TaxID=8005 RepID=A0AAY5EVT5_ELEEL